MDRLSSISVFFPCYNDAGTIGNLVLRAFDILPRIAEDYEVIVVDDCSKDGSLKVLDELAREFEELKVVRHGKNLGYGGALKSGFAHAQKDFIFYTDGDGQYDIGELLDLVPQMREGIDVVNGYKLKRSDAAHRVIIGLLYHHFVGFLFSLDIKDVDCDFRLFRRSVFDKVKLESDDGSICVELVKKCQDAGIKFAQVAVHHYRRPSGSSQFFKPDRIYRSLKGLGFLWYKTMKGK